MTVREVVIHEPDVATLGGLRLTVPLRTVVDLARFSAGFTAEDVSIVRALLKLGKVEIDECVNDIESRRNLPNKRRAIDRLSRCG